MGSLTRETCSPSAVSYPKSAKKSRTGPGETGGTEAFHSNKTRPLVGGLCQDFVRSATGTLMLASLRDIQGGQKQTFAGHCASRERDTLRKRHFVNDINAGGVCDGLCDGNGHTILCYGADRGVCGGRDESLGFLVCREEGGQQHGPQHTPTGSPCNRQTHKTRAKTTGSGPAKGRSPAGGSGAHRQPASGGVKRLPRPFARPAGPEWPGWRLGPGSPAISSSKAWMNASSWAWKRISCFFNRVPSFRKG